MLAQAWKNDACMHIWLLCRMFLLQIMAETGKHLKKKKKGKNITVPQISASRWQMPSVALTDKVPNEERSHGQEDQEPHENANQDSSLLLGRLLFVAEEVDPLTIVAVTSLVQKKNTRTESQKTQTGTCHSLHRDNVDFTSNQSEARS